RRVRLLLAGQARAPRGWQQPARAAPLQMPPRVPVAAEPVPTQPEPGLATVGVAPPQEESGAQRPRSEDYVAMAELKPVYFDFDKAALRPDAVDALTNNTAWLKENADTLVLIEGHSDDRRTTDHSLVLGARSSRSAT